MSWMEDFYFNGGELPSWEEIHHRQRRAGKREAAAMWAAITIMNGQSVAFASSTPEESERMRQRALEIIDEFDRIMGS